jgi:hypothetical protein
LPASGENAQRFRATINEVLLGESDPTHTETSERFLQEQYLRKQIVYQEVKIQEAELNCLKQKLDIYEQLNRLTSGKSDVRMVLHGAEPTLLFAGLPPLQLGPTFRNNEYRAISNNQSILLISMLELGAKDPDNLKSLEEIVVRGFGTHASPNNYKKDQSGLKKIGLIDTRPGRSGGNWLTEQGIKRATKLKLESEEISPILDTLSPPKK